MMRRPICACKRLGVCEFRRVQLPQGQRQRQRQQQQREKLAQDGQKARAQEEGRVHEDQSGENGNGQQAQVQTELIALVTTLQELIGTIDDIHVVRCACGSLDRDPLFAVTTRRASRSLGWYFVYTVDQSIWLKISFEGDLASFEAYFAMRNNIDGMQCHRLSASPSLQAVTSIAQQPVEEASQKDPQPDLAQVSKQRAVASINPDAAMVSPTTPLGLFGKLPRELRDLIFGHYTTLHTIPVHTSFDSSFPRWLQRHTFVMQNTGFLAVGGTIASQARGICSSLRQEYQQALETNVRKGLVRELLVVFWRSSRNRRALLRNVTCGQHPVLVIIFDDCPDPNTLDCSLRSCVQEMEAFQGTLDVRALFCVGDCRALDVVDFYAFPKIATTTIQAEVRLFAVQPVGSMSKDNQASYTPYARMVEVFSDATGVIRAVFRYSVSELLCVVLEAHIPGASAVDQMLWHHCEEIAASEAEVSVLDDLLCPPGKCFPLRPDEPVRPTWMISCCIEYVQELCRRIRGKARQ